MVIWCDQWQRFGWSKTSGRWPSWRTTACQVWFGNPRVNEWDLSTESVLSTQPKIMSLLAASIWAVEMARNKRSRWVDESIGIRHQHGCRLPLVFSNKFTAFFFFCVYNLVYFSLIPFLLYLFIYTSWSLALLFSLFLIPCPLFYLSFSGFSSFFFLYSTSQHFTSYRTLQNPFHSFHHFIRQTYSCFSLTQINRMDNSNLDLDGQTAPESTRGLFDSPDVSVRPSLIIHAVSITLLPYSESCLWLQKRWLDWQASVNWTGSSSQ